jgi:hypothetical protein
MSTTHCNRCGKEWGIHGYACADNDGAHSLDRLVERPLWKWAFMFWWRDVVIGWKSYRVARLESKMTLIQAANGQHQRCEPAAEDSRFASDTDGWLASAACCGWAVSTRSSPVPLLTPVTYVRDILKCAAPMAPASFVVGIEAPPQDHVLAIHP